MANNFDAMALIQALAQQKLRPPTEIPGVNVPDVDPYGFGPIPVPSKKPPINPVIAALNPPTPYIGPNGPPPQAPVQGGAMTPGDGGNNGTAQIPPVAGRPTRDQFFGSIPSYGSAPSYTPPVRDVRGEARDNLSGLAGSILGSILTGGRNAAASAAGYLNGAKGTQDEAYNAKLTQAQADYANQVNKVNAGNQNVTRQMGQAESQYDDATHNYEYDKSEQDRQARDAAAALQKQQHDADTLAEQTAKQLAAAKSAAQAGYIKRRAAQVASESKIINDRSITDMGRKQQAVQTINRINAETGLGTQDMPIPPTFTPDEMRQQANTDRSYGLQLHNSGRADQEFAQRKAGGGVKGRSPDVDFSDYGNKVRQANKDIDGYIKNRGDLQDQSRQILSQLKLGTVTDKTAPNGVRDMTPDERTEAKRQLAAIRDQLPAIQSRISDTATARDQYKQMQRTAGARINAPGYQGGSGTTGIRMNGLPPKPTPATVASVKPVTIDPSKLKGMSDADLFRIMATGK